MTQESVSPAHVSVNDVIRFVLELFAVFSVSFWGFAGWPAPWNIVVGLAAPITVILLWGLFRSPKAVFHIDAFGKALVEIVVFASVVFAWWTLGQPIIAVVFGVIAVVSGVINGRKEFS